MSWCAQVDLTTAVMRPGLDDPGLALVKQQVLDALQELPPRPATAASSADGAPEGRPAHVNVVVLSGTWQHDLDQARMLPTDKVS